MLEKAADKASLKWQKRDHQAFVTYMLRACSMVSSNDWHDQSKQALLLSRYAALALNSGDLPTEEYAEFVEFLTLDPITVDDATWKAVRLQKAELFLEAYQRFKNSMDPNFNFEDRPLLNVPTPPGSGMPSGIAPAGIKDPKLRLAYQNAIAQNEAKAKRYNDQYWLRRNAPRLFKETEEYLVNAYARKPVDLPQLKGLLSQYIVIEDTRNHILEEVLKRTP